MLFFSGRANPELSDRIKRIMNITPGRCRIDNFPDGEIGVVIEEDVMGREVFILQPTGPPVADNLLELLLLGDGCRRSGAARITALVPYFGYGRQDRKALHGGTVGARLAADLLAQRFDRLVVVDLHSPAIEGFFSIPVVHLSAANILAHALAADLSNQTDVLVAPDLGAVKLARNYADLLQLPMAFIHKERLDGSEVVARDVIGAVKNRRPIIVDDMISTGGTIVSAVEALRQNGSRPPLAVIATHGLLVDDALNRLAPLGIERVVVTNSLSIKPEDSPVRLEVADLAELLAGCIHHLFRNN